VVMPQAQPVPSISLHGNAPVVSRLILGLWRLASWQQSPQETLALVQQCVEWGITTFDHADIYGDYTCETLFGRALSGQSALRSQLQLITKCGIKLVSCNRPKHTLKHYDTSYEHILASVDASLHNLQTDYLDILLIHRPDPFMDADETAAAFTQLKQAGKVLHFGVSNFSPSQFDLLASRLSFPLVTNQIEISVMHLNAFTDGTLDQSQRLKMAPLAWSPLAGGHLFQEESPQALRLRQVLGEMARQFSQSHSVVSLDQVALAWLLVHPARIVPILGSGNYDRIQSAIAALSLPLTREQWFAIWTASTGTEVA